MTERLCRLRDLLEREAARRRLVITGHDAPDVDSVAACALMQRLLHALGIPAQIVLTTPADAQSRRVMPRFGVEPERLVGEMHPDDALILVDHHRPLHPGRVLACIDHHPTQETLPYPYVQVEPCGACALMALRLLEEADVPVSDADTALAVLALYLDTIALRSTKVSSQEIAWARAQAARLGLDEGWLEREGMHLRAADGPAKELAMLGRKVYDYGGRRVASTYLQTHGLTQEKLDGILDVLRGALAQEGAALWVFLVHDPVEGRSTEYDLTPDGAVAVRRYDTLVSRGKNVMPRVEQEMCREAGK